MIDEKAFGYAVTLTAAFIANCDIRWGGSTREDSSAMSKVEDMLTSLYAVTQSARDKAESSGH